MGRSYSSVPYYPTIALYITRRDLWGGNTGFIKPNIPVLFDPAVYYGDRETDVIMTQVENP